MRKPDKMLEPLRGAVPKPTPWYRIIAVLKQTGPWTQPRKVWSIKGLPDVERCLSLLSCYNKIQQADAEMGCVQFQGLE